MKWFVDEFSCHRGMDGRTHVWKTLTHNFNNWFLWVYNASIRTDHFPNFLLMCPCLCFEIYHCQLLACVSLWISNDIVWDPHVYVYLYTIYIYIYIYTYTHTCMYVCIHVYIYIYIYIKGCIHIRVHKCVSWQSLE